MLYDEEWNRVSRQTRTELSAYAIAGAIVFGLLYLGYRMGMVQL